MKTLEEPYRSRAIPAGSARYWSWLFAAPGARESLLGIYALMAEWQALSDPATEVDVARIKLAWWHDELRRLVAGGALHPITRYLADLPNADGAELSGLYPVVDAAAAQIAGVPLERADELRAHADALSGVPLRVAARLARCPIDAASLAACTASLAVAQYLARAVEDYRRDARVGRILFPIDELLAAHIDNDDLAAAAAPARLAAYLQELRRRSAEDFWNAARLLPAAERPLLRHVSVLAALGKQHVVTRPGTGWTAYLADLYNAWQAARHAAASH